MWIQGCQPPLGPKCWLEVQFILGQHSLPSSSVAGPNPPILKSLKPTLTHLLLTVSKWPCFLSTEEMLREVASLPSTNLSSHVCNYNHPSLPERREANLLSRLTPPTCAGISLPHAFRDPALVLTPPLLSLHPFPFLVPPHQYFNVLEYVDKLNWFFWIVLAEVAIGKMQTTSCLEIEFLSFFWKTLQ